jgi:hypothetical protein
MRIAKSEHQEKLRTDLLELVKEIFNYRDRDMFLKGENLGMEKTFEKWIDRLIVVFEKNKGA